eukprot:gene27922-34504_t
MSTDLLPKNVVHKNDKRSLLDKSLDIYNYVFFEKSDTLTFLKEQFEQWKATSQKPKTRIAVLKGASLDDAIQHLKHRVPIFRDGSRHIDYFRPPSPSVLYFDEKFGDLVGRTTEQCEAQWKQQSNDILYAVVGETKLKTSPDRKLYIIHTWCVDLQYKNSSDYKIYYLPGSNSFDWDRFTDRYKSILRLIVGSAVAFGDSKLRYRVRCPLIGMLQHLKAITKDYEDLPENDKEKQSPKKAYDCFVDAVKSVFPLNAEWVAENAPKGLEFTFCSEDKDSKYLTEKMQTACEFINELEFKQEDLLRLPEESDRVQDIVVDIWTKRTFIGNGGLRYNHKSRHSRMLMPTSWKWSADRTVENKFENDSYLHNHIFHPEMLQKEAIMVIPNRFLSRSEKAKLYTNCLIAAQEDRKLCGEMAETVAKANESIETLLGADALWRKWIPGIVQPLCEDIDKRASPSPKHTHAECAVFLEWVIDFMLRLLLYVESPLDESSEVRGKLLYVEFRNNPTIVANTVREVQTPYVRFDFFKGKSILEQFVVTKSYRAYRDAMVSLYEYFCKMKLFLQKPNICMEDFYKRKQDYQDLTNRASSDLQIYGKMGSECEPVSEEMKVALDTCDYYFSESDSS